MISYGKYISKWINIFLLLFCFSTTAAEASGITFKGKVLSVENKALFGAHVAIPSIGRGTITNENGGFILTNIPKGKYQVVISYIGFESEIRVINFESEKLIDLTVKLKPTTIHTEPIVVTGRPFATNPLDSPQDISYLSGREKIKSESASIGKSLENLPGIYNLSAGSVAGKPVIRGYTSERVLILSDGVTQEYQQYGERHSPNIESFNYDRIEIIKGTASLLYGSDAMGGAVNLIPHPFHFSEDGKTELDGSIAGGYYSNNNEYMAGLKLYGSTGNLSYNANIIRRKADNFYAPDAATYSETLKRGDPKFTGEIPNTNFEQLNGSAGLGFLSPIGIFSIDYDHYLNKNNFLLPTGLPIGLQLENQILNFKGNIPLDKFIVKPKFSYQSNHRQATLGGFDYTTLPDSAAVDLKLNVYTARIEMENVDVLNLSGTFGAEVKYYENKNVGKVPLQPTGHFTNYSFFLFEEWQSNRLIFNFGARLDYREQLFYGTTTNPLLTTNDSRNYSNISSSFGAAFKLTDQLTITGNIGKGFRTPSFYNLYVYGEHGGVFAFQIGNPNLKNETSIDLSTALRYKNKFINAEATLFHNIINNYIFLYSSPDHPLAPAGQAFVFAHDQADATLTGIELYADISVFNWLTINGTYSNISSKFTSGVHNGSQLPLMPPAKGTIGLKFLLPDFTVLKSPYLGINTRFVSGKNAAGIYEPFVQFDDGIGPDIPFGVCSTEKYHLFGLNLGFDLTLYNKTITIDLEITNLLDEDYRDFLDTYKGYALSPGRSVNVKTNIPFVFN